MERSPPEARDGDLQSPFHPSSRICSTLGRPVMAREQLEGLSGEINPGVVGAEVPAVSGPHEKRNAAVSGRFDQALGGKGEPDANWVAVRAEDPSPTGRPR